MFIFFFFCIIGPILGSSTSGGTTEETIERLNKAVGSYRKAFDQLDGWDILRQNMAESSLYQNEYSNSIGSLIGKIKTSLMNSEDIYFSAKQPISNWCSYSKGIFEAYVGLFKEYNGENAAAQNELLQDVFKEGKENMRDAISKLEQTSSGFNEASSKLSELTDQLSKDYSEGSNYFQNRLRAARVKASNNVTSIQVILNKVEPVVKEFSGSLSNIPGIVDTVGGLKSTTMSPSTLDEEIITNMKATFGTVQRFYANFKNSINVTKNKIDNTVAKLRDEIKAIENSGIQLNVNSKLDKAHHTSVEKAVSEFNTQCRSYLATYGRV